MLNSDEILRIPQNKLLVIIRGNKPLLLNKMIYTEHELAKNLEDVSIINMPQFGIKIWEVKNNSGKFKGKCKRKYQNREENKN